MVPAGTGSPRVDAWRAALAAPAAMLVPSKKGVTGSAGWGALTGARGRSVRVRLSAVWFGADDTHFGFDARRGRVTDGVSYACAVQCLTQWRRR